MKHIGILFGVVTICAVSASAGRGQTPPASATAADSRATLDEAMRLASDTKYDAAIKTFEDVKAQHPEAVTGLDGLKMVVVYAEVGNQVKYEELTRWLLARYGTPKTSTDAERAVKGYIVSRGATRPDLLAQAVTLTTYASEHAAADGEGQYQEFFDTSRGVAQYRVGHFDDAIKWLSKTIDHTSLLVRGLAQPFYAMAELKAGHRKEADEMYARAVATAADLPKPGTAEFSVDWTDILIARGAIAEAKAAFGR